MSNYKFLLNPNLPENNISHAVVSLQYPAVYSALEQLGITVCGVAPCADVLLPVSQHADMLFSYLGKGSFVCEKSQTLLRDFLVVSGFECVGEYGLSAAYPGDIALNCCIIGARIICNCANTPNKLKEQFSVVNTRQGYAKCSCAVVDENSVITDDKSISDALVKSGLDVLLVQKGSVRLDGFDYGFIGGCCGKISADCLAFCGELNNHPDCRQIDAFLRERKVYPCSLFGGELTDIGSIIPVAEYI